VSCGALMAGVVRWFEKRGEIPLAPPPAVREYGSLTDDPDRFGGGYSTAGIRGVAFAVEYLDSRGWASIRTIRCLGIDTRHPASLTAYCRVREKVCKFRIDRIISIMELRTGRIVSSDEHVTLLAPYLPNDDPEPYLCALVDLQNGMRDAVFALLQVAMIDGRLDDESRDIMLDYVKAEADVLGLQLPAFELVELWIDNLAPQLDAVSMSVMKLLQDKDRFARLLPWLMKVVRSKEAFPKPEDSVRDLIAEVRTHYRNAPRDRPKTVRATN
jgi:hypothetical protein